VQCLIHCILLILSKANHAVSTRLSSARKKNDARAGQLLLGTCDGFPRAKPRFGEFAAAISSTQTAALNVLSNGYGHPE
jgi:hypothetical protein